MKVALRPWRQVHPRPALAQIYGWLDALESEDYLVLCGAGGPDFLQCRPVPSGGCSNDIRWGARLDCERPPNIHSDRIDCLPFDWLNRGEALQLEAYGPGPDGRWCYWRCQRAKADPAGLRAPFTAYHQGQPLDFTGWQDVSAELAPLEAERRQRDSDSIHWLLHQLRRWD